MKRIPQFILYSFRKLSNFELLCLNVMNFFIFKQLKKLEQIDLSKFYLYMYIDKNLTCNICILHNVPASSKVFLVEGCWFPGQWTIGWSEITFFDKFQALAGRDGGCC